LVRSIIGNGLGLIDGIDKMKGYMYILLCGDGSYYTGSTKYLQLRLQQHQNGEGANHTRKHQPVKLVYFEIFDRIDTAFYREKQIQGWGRAKKEALINGAPNIDEQLHELAKCLNETSHENRGFGSAQPPASTRDFGSAQSPATTQELGSAQPKEPNRGLSKGEELNNKRDFGSAQSPGFGCAQSPERNRGLSKDEKLIKKPNRGLSKDEELNNKPNRGLSGAEVRNDNNNTPFI